MKTLIAKIEAAGFKSADGPLATYQAWQLLKAELVLEGILQPTAPGEETNWRNFDRTLPKRNDRGVVYTMGTDAVEMVQGSYSIGEQEPTPEDELYPQAVQIVREMQMASISALQRRLRIGYNRAWRMMEAMEQDGYVKETEHGKWEVLPAAGISSTPHHQEAS